MDTGDSFLRNVFDDIFDRAIFDTQFGVQSLDACLATTTSGEVDNLNFRSSGSGFDDGVVFAECQLLNAPDLQPDFAPTLWHAFEDDIAAAQYIGSEPDPSSQQLIDHYGIVNFSIDGKFSAENVSHAYKKAEDASNKRCHAVKGKRLRPSLSRSSNPSSHHRPCRAPRKKLRFHESQTNLLEQWLSNNLSDPFPDQDTKTTLAQATGLTSRQVGRWFARTRQRKLKRLKPWESSNCSDEEAVSRGWLSGRYPRSLKHSRGRDFVSNQHEACSLDIAVRPTIESLIGGRMPRDRLSDGHFSSGRPCAFNPAVQSIINRSAAGPRPQSCPPSTRASNYLRLIQRRKNTSLPATQEEYSLEVGFTSFAGSRQFTSISADLNWQDWEAGYHPRPLLWHAQDWGIGRWLDLLPADPQDYEFHTSGGQPSETHGAATNSAEQSREPTTCSTCFAKTTALWHRNTEGRTICNLCMLLRLDILTPTPALRDGADDLGSGSTDLGIRPILSASFHPMESPPRGFGKLPLPLHPDARPFPPIKIRTWPSVACDCCQKGHVCRQNVRRKGTMLILALGQRLRS